MRYLTDHQKKSSYCNSCCFVFVSEEIHISSAGCGDWDPTERKLVPGQKGDNLNCSWQKRGQLELLLAKKRPTWTGSPEESSFRRFSLGSARCTQKHTPGLDQILPCVHRRDKYTKHFIYSKIILLYFSSHLGTWLGNDRKRSLPQLTCISLVLNMYTVYTLHVLISIMSYE